MLEVIMSTEENGPKFIEPVASAALRLSEVLTVLQKEVGDMDLLDLSVFLFVCGKSPEAVEQAEIVKHFTTIAPRETVRRSLKHLDRDGGLGLITRTPSLMNRTIKDVILTPLGRVTAKRFVNIMDGGKKL
jgi:hypothetical protein